MFIMKKVFDPELQGKAILISGHDAEGDEVNHLFLIKSVEGEMLTVVNCQGADIVCRIEDFDAELLKMQVLEIPVVKAETLPELPFDDIEDHPPVKPRKTGFTRNQGTRNVRSDLQIKVDNAHVEYILKSNGEPLKLEKIVSLMQINHGHYHWNKNNGSGFIQHAIKLGKKIKKVEYGVYGYDWEAGE